MHQNKKIGETKRQHYVPKMLLKNFSSDEKLINVFILRRKQFKTLISIKEQCYSDYFYGADGIIEDYFSDIEGKVAEILRKLLNHRADDVLLQDMDLLRLFIHFQAHRTLAAAMYYRKAIGQLTTNVAREFFNSFQHNFEMNELNFKLGVKSPQMEMLLTAFNSIPVILDLELRLLIHEGNADFVISDHPVVLYNQFAENHPSFSQLRSITGLTSKGLQIFMPISRRACIALFDPATYVYGNEKSFYCQIGNRDVERLNQLQLINSNLCLYFHPETRRIDRFSEYTKQRDRYQKQWESAVSEIDDRNGDNGDDSKLISINKPSIRVGTKLSCVQVIDTNPYGSYRHRILPPRSADLINTLREHKTFMTTDMGMGTKKGT